MADLIDIAEVACILCVKEDNVYRRKAIPASVSKRRNGRVWARLWDRESIEIYAESIGIKKVRQEKDKVKQFKLAMSLLNKRILNVK